MFHSCIHSVHARAAVLVGLAFITDSDAATCLHWCRSPCNQLNGNFRKECGACGEGSRRGYRCFPGAEGFDAVGGHVDGPSSRSDIIQEVTSPAAGLSTLEWLPQRHNGICAFTTAIDSATSLLVGIEHNANWAVSHGCSFTLFRAPMAKAGVHHQWQKVLAAQRMLEAHGPSGDHRGAHRCRWLFHLDADALVVDVERSPETVLRRLEADAAPARPVVFATCNSPLGGGSTCDTVCCVRARDGAGCCRPPRGTAAGGAAACSVGLHDVGPASPYPCMINSGVFFVRVGPAAAALVAAWVAKQDKNSEVFGEQASLNELKEATP